MDMINDPEIGPVPIIPDDLPDDEKKRLEDELPLPVAA